MFLLAKAYAELTANSISPFEMVESNNIDIRRVGMSVVNFLLTLSAIIAVIFLLYSGILYLTAAGNEDNANKGKKGIINAIIGIIVIVLALVIIRVTNNAAVDAVNGTTAGGTPPAAPAGP